jgi:hypothetical protein
MLIFAFIFSTILVTHSISLSQANRENKPDVSKAKLTKAQVAKIKGGMTLSEVMALLGSRAEINPDPAPFGYAAPEVVILWREGKDRNVGVVFVPDDHRVLRVLDISKTGGTYMGSTELPEK